MNKFHLAIPLFLFLFIIISSPTLAYYPIDIMENVTLPDMNYRAFRCLNQTDNAVYCYAMSDGYITRYNATLQDPHSCTITGNLYGGFIVNETMACGVAGVYTDCFNITGIVSGGACPQLNRMGNIKSTDVNNGLVTAITTYNNNWTYYTKPFGIFENVNETLVSSSFIPNTYCYPYYYSGFISAPTRTTNSTFYFTYQGCAGVNESMNWRTDLYTNGVYVSTTDDFESLYGIDDAQSVCFTPFYLVDIIEVNGTEYMYILDENVPSCGPASDILYRVNFEYALNFSAVEFYPISPLTDDVINVGYDSTTLYFTLYLNSSNSGTIYYYYDGEYLSETPVNSTNIDNQMFVSSVYETASGSHNWTAYFVDNTSTQWNFDETQTFTLNLETAEIVDDFFDDPFGSIAQTIGSMFGVTNESDAENISGIALSFIFSIMTTIFMVRLKVSGSVLGLTFLGGLIFWIIFFTALGWVSPLFLIIIIIVIGFMLAKQLNLIGG